jgi:putative SOS response-associated peptidase YedK
MCYHVAIQSGAQALSRRYKATSKVPITWKGSPHLAGFSNPQVPLVVQSEEPVLELAQWGLVPPWLEPGKEGPKEATLGLNARLETVDQKPWFKSSLGQRGILPVDAFFEWQHNGKFRQPHRIQSLDGTLSLACIVQAHPGLITFAVLTREASPAMARIHNHGKRMPWMLPTQNIDAWLNPDLSWKEAAALASLPEDQWQAFPISGHGASEEAWTRPLNPNPGMLF